MFNASGVKKLGSSPLQSTTDKGLSFVSSGRSGVVRDNKVFDRLEVLNATSKG